jgi:hypothetical protein
MIVNLGDEFLKQLRNYPKADKEKIYNFIQHVQQCYQRLNFDPFLTKNIVLN